MNATATLPPDVAAYLDRVRAALADVPPEERDEMLADLEVSLLEGGADSAESPEARLGPPERFAQELRAAAGLEAGAPGAAGEPGLRERFTALLETPRARAALGTARELAPAWWVARGWVAAGLLASAAGFAWSDQWPLVPAPGTAIAGLLLLAGGIVASVWLGLRTRRQPKRRRWLVALNAALAVLVLPIAASAMDGRDRVVEAYSEPTPPPATDRLNVSGDPIANVYPYSRDGKLLLDVLLYDQDGRPLEIGSADPQEDPLRRYLFTKRGEPLLNSFPIRYVEPGSTKVKNPLAAPKRVRIPELATPPLKVKRP